MMAAYRSCRRNIWPRPGERTRQRCPISSPDARRFRVGAPPKSVVHLAIIGLAVTALVIALSWLTLLNLQLALAVLEQKGAFTTTILLLLAAAACYLLWPAWRCLTEARAARVALKEGEVT